MKTFDVELVFVLPDGGGTIRSEREYLCATATHALREAIEYMWLTFGLEESPVWVHIHLKA